jgi:hypothetical protein
MVTQAIYARIGPPDLQNPTSHLLPLFWFPQRNTLSFVAHRTNRLSNEPQDYEQNESPYYRHEETGRMECRSFLGF